jgi:hypothetical protein
MELKDIIAITGQSGLYKAIGESKNGVIVESLIDKKRMPVFMTSRISSLDDIAIYTDEKEVPLKDIFKNIFDKENGGEAISQKASNDEIKKYFAQILPNYDEDRVYISDMKKVINWYNTLHRNNLVTFEKKEKVAKKAKAEKAE